MVWEFETDPEFEAHLEWMRAFVEEEVEPLDLLWGELHHASPPPWLREVIDPLKQQVRDRGLWACHLGPELGGKGFGQVNLALMNEILGRTRWGPTIFGTQAPDTGNAEIIARFGTQDQKKKYLQPLLDGELFSAFSMTEPQGGADPREFRCRAYREGQDWVIEGEKFFTSNARNAAFFIVMAVTNPDVDVYKGTSMFLVPSDTPGIEILRNVGTMGESAGDGVGHAHISYNGVRVPPEAMLGEEGQGFVVAQSRLGGGRIHHAMRAVGLCNKAFEMMCERALSRHTQGSLLAEKQLVQQQIAESYADIQQFRLFVLQTAWKIDRHGAAAVRKDIAAAMVQSTKALQSVVGRAMHIHGALGVSNETPLGRMWMEAPMYGIFDGPTEVHTITVARQVLREHHAAPGVWPTRWLPAAAEAARQK
ncbi:MAG: acyl-CoA dehydrogenase family protein, partial [Actinomycetota bacterium]